MTEPSFQGTEHWAAVEEALRRSQVLATAGQFATAVVHEINNPLEAIANLAYLTREEAEHPDKVREYTRLLQEQLDSLIGIARQTLSYSRLTEAMQATDVAQLAEAALRVHEPKINAKRIRLMKDLPTEVKVKVRPGEMLQVVSNLVANAIEALPLHGTLCLRVWKSDRELHLIVADDGHGIPESELRKVFDPFFSTRKDRGTGLGLAISKSIVERHNGRIKTRSSVREGRNGTAFRISLPLHGEDEVAS